MAPIAAKLVSESKPYIVPGQVKVRELWFQVPLDYAKPTGKTIKLFARRAVKYEKPIVETPEDTQKPFLVYLQGGPGFGNPAPQDSPLCKSMLDRGYELLLLDYRGVGLSTPVSADTLKPIGGPQEQADYLKLFRADTIVKDSEAVRLCLTEKYPPEKKKWSIFGQSFGGMTSMSYLSFAPEGLRESFITGGLAALDKGPEEVYQATFCRLIDRNKAYYKKFPEDVESVKFVAQRILELGGEQGIPMPAGGFLTFRIFLTIGISLGMDGGLDRVHNLVVKAKADLDLFGFLTRSTLNTFEQELGWDCNPIYALLHEPCWSYGPGVRPNWAAERVGRSLEEYPWLCKDWSGPSSLGDKPLYFLGEMVPSFLFDSHAELSKMKDTAQILAEFDGWTPLYDMEQLAKNEVPVYAASYNDMYVDPDMARVTASRIQGIKLFETNVMFHSALRAKPDEVLRELFRLRDDTID